MCMPCCASPGLERDTDREHACRSYGLGQWVNAYHAGKILVRSFARRLRTALFDIHFLNSFSDGNGALSPVCLRKTENLFQGYIETNTTDLGAKQMAS